MSPGIRKARGPGDASYDLIIQASTSAILDIGCGMPTKKLLRKLWKPMGSTVMDGSNWFEITAQPNFGHFLMPFRGKPNLRFLQIGAFRGDATCWLLDNILTGSGCKLHDIDPWGRSDDYRDLDQLDINDWDEVYRQYEKRTHMWASIGKLESHRMTSNDYFSTPRTGDLMYDFVYIDGAHDAVSVIEDAVHAYRRLKLRGIMAFDDYTWKAADSEPIHAPGMAIDAFRLLYASRMVAMIVNSQVWMMKVR